MNKLTEKRGIVCMFHIGRGGRFYNAGYTTFEGFKRIDECHDWNQNSFIEDEWSLKERLLEDPDYDGELGVFDCDGNMLMDAYEMQQACGEGIGRLDFDGDYDTTYTHYFEDLEEDLLEILIKSYGFEDLKSYIKSCGRMDLFDEMVEYLERRGRWDLLPDDDEKEEGNDE